MTIIKSAYTPRERNALKTDPASKTQQNFKAECDINTILKKYRKTGLLEHVNQYAGKYEDLSEPTDYQTALNIVISAQASFDSLPSYIRKKFDNDPAQFLDFVNNPDNLDEMQKMGLTNETPAESIQPPVETVPVEPPKVETPAP